jgi:hypothetical protein
MFHLQSDAFTFDSLTLSHDMPILHEKLKSNKPLKMELSFKNMKVMFGENDNNVALDYIATISLTSDSAPGTLGAINILYDEIPMFVSMNMKTQKDDMLLYFTELRLDMDSKYGMRAAPLKNWINFSESEYHQWLAQLEISIKTFRKWIDTNILSRGMPFKYNMNEIYTYITFKQQQLNINFEIERDVEEYLEKNFWADKIG